MVIEYSVLQQFKPFLVGYCNCGCGGEIRYSNKYIKKRFFIFNHHNRGERSKSWKNGRTFKKSTKYWFLSKPYHPNSNKRGYIAEHRYIMSEFLGRPLKKGEVVHHINENKKDNRIENLMLLPNNGVHTSIHLKGNKLTWIDKSNWLCLICKKKTYVDKNGREQWYKYKDGHICNTCYNIVKKRKNKE